MAKRRRIYEGRAKDIYEGPEPGTLVQHFKDDASAFNNTKRGTITGKGVINNRISEFLMSRLQEIGVPNHFIRRLNMREQLVREVEIIPIGVVIRNVVAGSMAKRLGIKEGTQLPPSITGRTRNSAIRWFQRSILPHSAGPCPRTSTTCCRCRCGSTTS